jgi:hypothetical protein
MILKAKYRKVALNGIINNDIGWLVGLDLSQLSGPK